MKSLSEVDQETADAKQFRDALGEEGMKKFAALSASCLESAESNLFEFSPKMSYPPAAWVQQNPGFWKQKAAAAPAKKEAAKPVQ